MDEKGQDTIVTRNQYLYEVTDATNGSGSFYITLADKSVFKLELPTSYGDGKIKLTMSSPLLLKLEEGTIREKVNTALATNPDLQKTMEIRILIKDTNPGDLHTLFKNIVIAEVNELYGDQANIEATTLYSSEA
ncbi:hypothetical protein KC678_00425 [Candidatus Dojkabacteria bacterium]|uniref:Uncharacterized protein n=1 Tax=Candidatus Dojkabacteria bacterium TaxID=2099670 RepID=A0A955I9W1_9BACT|nr:hypothetical protein [Candidatus Dojkabacteria bacterium]